MEAEAWQALATVVTILGAFTAGVACMLAGQDTRDVNKGCSLTLVGMTLMLVSIGTFGRKIGVEGEKAAILWMCLAAVMVLGGAQLCARIWWNNQTKINTGEDA